MWPSPPFRSRLLPRRAPSAAAAALAAAVWVLSAIPALAAAGTGEGTSSEVVFLVELVLLIVVGRLFGEAMQRLGQPAVIGQLIAGILLGPSLLGVLAPELQHAIFPDRGTQKAMIEAVSQLGILLLLLLTGMETDLRLVRKVGRAAVSVSIAGVSVPFACGFLLGQFMPDDLLPAADKRLITSLFLGTALAISSVKIVALIVREMNFMRRNIGQVIIASAIIDDTIGWIVIALTFSLAQHGSVDAASLAKSVIGTAAFLVVSLTIGRRVVFDLIRLTNDHFTSEFAVISVILAIMGAMALTTHAIGVHSVLGAFIAGVLVGESPILTRHIDEQLRGLVAALFAPVFFGLAGLGTDLTVLANGELMLLMVAVIAIASVGKFVGAFIGGRFGGLKGAESLALACGMNARGSTEVIVASIGLSLGVLSHDLFTVIVAMAVVTTMAMPPTLRWALARLPMGEEERKRLEREEFESRGFVANLERLLVAVDDSAAGKLAARLAGLIAGQRGMPTTLLHVRPDEKEDDSLREKREKIVAKSAAVAARAEEDEEAVRPVELMSRQSVEAPERELADEAGKGYDLLMIGVEETAAAHAFGPDISRLACEFDGPIAIAVARGDLARRPIRARLDILVPVTGTEASRRATEVAILLARAVEGRVSALRVAAPEAAGARRTRKRRHEQAILDDAVDIAERYETVLRTTLRVDDEPDAAIMREARRGRHNLIVIGVNRRPGDTLFFGDVADSILNQTDCSILFVAGGAASTPGRANQQGREGRAKRDNAGSEGKDTDGAAEKTVEPQQV